MLKRWITYAYIFTPGVFHQPLPRAFFDMHAKRMLRDETGDDET